MQCYYSLCLLLMSGNASDLGNGADLALGSSNLRNLGTILNIYLKCTICVCLVQLRLSQKWPRHARLLRLLLARCAIRRWSRNFNYQPDVNSAFFSASFSSLNVTVSLTCCVDKVSITQRWHTKYFRLVKRTISTKLTLYIVLLGRQGIFY